MKDDIGRPPICYLELSRGKRTEVSVEDFEYLNQWKWSYGTRGYAFKSFTVRGKKKTITLHRFLLKPRKGEYVDHVNGDRLDNRRFNLRLCTSGQNNQNSKQRAHSQQFFKGVRPTEGSSTWAARIRYEGKERWIGSFKNPIHAAVAYDLWAVYLFGSFARTNFPTLENNCNSAS